MRFYRLENINIDFHIPDRQLCILIWRINHGLHLQAVGCKLEFDIHAFSRFYRREIREFLTLHRFFVLWYLKFWLEKWIIKIDFVSRHKNFEISSQTSNFSCFTSLKRFSISSTNFDQSFIVSVFEKALFKIVRLYSGSFSSDSRISLRGL